MDDLIIIGARPGGIALAAEAFAAWHRAVTNLDFRNRGNRLRMGDYFKGMKTRFFLSNLREILTRNGVNSVALIKRQTLTSCKLLK